MSSTLLLLFLVLNATDVSAQSETNTAPITSNGLSIDRPPQSPSLLSRDDVSSEDGASSITIDLTEDKRFDVYLSSPEIPKTEADAYSYDMSLILTFLDNNNPSGAKDMLPLLSQSPALDMGLSEQLLGKINSVLDVQQLSSKIEKTDGRLQGSLEKPDRTQDEIADAIRKQSEEQGGQEKSTPDAPPAQDLTSNTVIISPPPGIPGTPALTEEYVQNLQTKAKIGLDEQEKDRLLQETQMEFGLYVSRLYEAHHYHHVILAAAFYRQLFQLKDYPPDMKAEINDALNINKKVSGAIATSRGHLEHGEVSQATSQLETAFGLDSFNAELMAVPQLQKMEIKGFRDKLNQLKSILQAKDFNKAEVVLRAIRVAAPDFDESSLQQSVQSAEAKSQALLNKGKDLLKTGNESGAIQLFQEAEEVWPSNPDLLGGALPLLNSEEAKNKALAEFDDLWRQKDYLALKQRADEFTPLLSKDSQREGQMRSAQQFIADASTAATQASMLQGGGNFDGAWEVVQRALIEWPESVELNRMRGDLADKAGTFALAIGKAQEAESRQDLGLSLSWYAVAQHYYKASVLAKEGISRLSKTILNKT